ncbi:hypothetical protein BaRGS_00022681 [Batillaria attramentaria]|uniref:Uncharacterized protein n=1 Tax=Batillaria attramentaria TaxID=370345 RepID=A0ABD0KG30_9CAEN
MAADFDANLSWDLTTEADKLDTWGFDLDSRQSSHRNVDIALSYDWLHPYQQQDPLVDTFDLRDLSDSYIKKYFRFHSAADIEMLADQLQMPGVMFGANGVKASGNLE